MGVTHAIARPSLTWTRQSAAGTWWWGCTPCAKRRPVVGGREAARRLLRRHIKGPRHVRNLRRLTAKRQD